MKGGKGNLRRHFRKSYGDHVITTKQPKMSSEGANSVLFFCIARHFRFGSFALSDGVCEEAFLSFFSCMEIKLSLFLSLSLSLPLSFFIHTYDGDPMDVTTSKHNIR